MYHDDTDFCYRAKRAGLKLIYLPAAKLLHKASSLTGGPDPISAFDTARATKFIMLKHLGLWRGFLYLPAFQARLLLRLISRKIDIPGFLLRGKPRRGLEPLETLGSISHGLIRSDRPRKASAKNETIAFCHAESYRERQRTVPYLPVPTLLGERRVRSRVRPFAGRELFQAVQAGRTATQLFYVPFSSVRRAFDIYTVPRYDVVVIHREAFPFFAHGRANAPAAAFQSGLQLRRCDSRRPSGHTE